jgi:hypothetical protein
MDEWHMTEAQALAACSARPNANADVGISEFRFPAFAGAGSN